MKTAVCHRCEGTDHIEDVHWDIDTDVGPMDQMVPLCKYCRGWETRREKELAFEAEDQADRRGMTV